MSDEQPLLRGFELKHRIGSVDGATLWTARRLVDGVEVNLQVLDPAIGRLLGFAARLAAVAHQVAPLHHPRIVSTVEVATDDGTVALVTEAALGVPLSAILDADGTLPPAAAIAAADDVLRAVGAAHGGGLVHCGIVPERVLVGTDGEIRLDGFALARALALTGGELGAPRRGYASPERLGGALPDGIGDLYAAAALTNAMLSGSTPGPGAATPIPALPGMSAVIGQAVAADPSRRFPSASALRAAITSTAVETLGQDWRSASDLGARARQALVDAGVLSVPAPPPAPSMVPATVPAAPSLPAPQPPPVPFVFEPEPRRHRGRRLLLLVLALLIVAGGAAAGIVLLTRGGSSTTTGPLTVGDDVKLDVTKSVTGDCNVTLHFVATGSLSGQGTVTYEFRPSDGMASGQTNVVITNQPGFSFDFTYMYTGHRSGSATMTFAITSPQQRSAQKQYDTTCP